MGVSPSAVFANPALDNQCINTIRFLSVDAVQKANSGHPGLPLGAAPMAYVLWTRFLKHNPANPGLVRSRPLRAVGRPRLDAAVQPAAPDRLRPVARRHQAVPPMGQQDARASGARPHAGRRSHHRAARPGLRQRASAWRSPKRTSPRATTARASTIVDHYTYAIVSDGDLMEGVASEAASLAGHLRLGKLICLYDDNHVTLSAGTDITFTEDRARALRGLWLARRSRSPTATTSPRSTRRCARRAPRRSGRR